MEAFVEFLLEEERDSFDHVELRTLCEELGAPTSEIRKELEDWGLVLKARPKVKTVRGVTSWDNNRWEGNPCGGGSGWEQIAGFSGKKG